MDKVSLMRNILALSAQFLSGASARWIDSQPDTCQRVYFANHTSHLDAVVLWSALPANVRELTRPVAAKEGDVRAVPSRLEHGVGWLAKWGCHLDGLALAAFAHRLAKPRSAYDADFGHDASFRLGRSTAEY